MAELTIDNRGVELGNNRLVFSKSGYSFDDWVTKDLPYSERVTLPETSILNSIFYRPYSPDIIARKFSKYHTYKYKDNGKIVSSGIAKLLDFNESKEYEVQLIDSSYALFENLDNDLNNLDLESSDFVFNSTNYNSLKVLNSSVWVWSASSMHESKTLSKNILSGNLAFSRPFFSVKRLIEAMFSANGWTYNLGINTELFDKLIISSNSEFLFTSYEKAFTGSFTTGNLTLSSPNFVYSDTTPTASTWVLSNGGKIRLRGNAVADNDFIITLTVTGVEPFIQTFVINKGSFDYDLYSNDIEPGDTASISITGSGSVELDNFLIYNVIDENDFGAMSSALFTGCKVKTYDNLPDISQKDLFKNCLVKIGGYFLNNNFKKLLSINSIVSLSKLGALDWTSKFIEDSDNTSPLTSYGKTNFFNYENSDLKPSNLGRGSFAINNETLPDSMDIYDSIFEASQEVTITDIMIDNTIYNDTERINDIGTLIGYYEEVGSYTVARFENLNGNSILANYYTDFIKAIQKGEIIEARFNLNKSDFFLFDFSKLVYLQQKKSIFYVIGLNNYSENDLTDVALLKT